MLSDPLFIVAAIACLVVLVILMIGIGGFARGGDFNKQTCQPHHALADLCAGGGDRDDPARSSTRAQMYGELMVVLSKIYTKTGDAGETALGNGARVAKHSMRVTAYGTVDETNAIARPCPPACHAARWTTALARIQNDLFDLGADLCRPTWHGTHEAGYTPLRMLARPGRRGWNARSTR